MTIAFGRTPKDALGTIVSYEWKWDRIVELFREPVRGKITTEKYKTLGPEDARRHKNTGLFFGGRCAEGHRSSESVLSRTIVNLDLDHDCDWLWDEFQMLGEFMVLSGLDYLVHTTRSSSPESPRFRILIPLARELTPAEYEPVARALAFRLDPSMKAVARESFTVAQGMYFPSVSSDQEYHFAAFDGDYFDPDPVLLEYPADRPDTWPRRAKEVCQAWKPGRRMVHPEEKKETAPIITAVHRAIGPYQMLEDVLADHYRVAGDRYAPVTATGAASVRVYDDAFIQSDHESDPARGQHNAFDVGRIHLFRHLDDGYDLYGMSPVEWPSYKAMVEAMLERDDVRQAYDEIIGEVQAEKMSSMIGMLDDFDEDESQDEDLIGEPTKATIEDVLAKARRVIGKAQSLNDLIRRIEAVRALPLKEFNDTYRGLLATDIQKKFEEIGQEKPTKAEAKKMLRPTVDDLREQVKQKPMPEWLKEWAYITSENTFINLNTKERLAKEGFNGRFNKEIGPEFGTTEMGLTLLTAFDAATQVFAVPMPYSTKFDPFREAMFEEGGVLYVNTYRKPVVEDGGYRGNEGVKLLKRFIADIFRSERDQQLVMDFIAHCVKFPGKKLTYALLIKGAEKEGKSLLGTLIRQLVGRDNSAIVMPDALKEKFNGYSYEKLFLLVEEIKIVGKEGYEVLNKIKPTITNNEIPVRRMQKDLTTESNYANVMLTTNFEDCLPMAEDNTRFCVIFTRFLTNGAVQEWKEKRVAEEGRDYVKVLWEHIWNRPAQFVPFFEEYRFSKFYDPDERAPWTPYKRIVAEDAKSDEQHLLEEALESREDPTICDDILLWSSVKYLFDTRGIGAHIKGKAVSSFLKPMGFLRANRYSMLTDGRTQTFRIWTKNPDYVDGDGNLTESGKIRFRELYLAREELDEPVSNVVPLRR